MTTGWAGVPREEQTPDQLQLTGTENCEDRKIEIKLIRAGKTVRGGGRENVLEELKGVGGSNRRSIPSPGEIAPSSKDEG